MKRLPDKRSFPGRARRTVISLLLFALWASLPLSRMAWSETIRTIAVDAGHSEKSPGAISARNIGEYTFNKRIADLLPAQFRGSTIEPILINEDGGDISLAGRAELINQIKPGLLISIHHDSVQPVYLSQWIWNGKTASYCDKYSGFSIFYSEKNKKSSESLRLAHLLGSELVKAGFRPSLHHAEKIKGENREIISKEKGIYRFDDLVILKSAECPGVLLECGIIKNRQDELLLGGTSYQLKIAVAIRKAVTEFAGQ
ncbi:MAG: N-acetylmuramoyl-L-alanine amidase [Syntrophobacteraceae bacterium]